MCGEEPQIGSEPLRAWSQMDDIDPDPIANRRPRVVLRNMFLGELVVVENPV